MLVRWAILLRPKGVASVLNQTVSICWDLQIPRFEDDRNSNKFMDDI